MTLLSASGLSKSYGGAAALSGVDLDLRAGEVHAVVGENGAGKSTLIKILAGALQPDAGEVRLDDEPLPLGDALGVRRRGVSVVYQEFTLIPELSVADNVFLGRERGALLLRRSEMNEAVRVLLDELGTSVRPSAPVRHLRVAQQQIVEVARALVCDAKVLIFDEPTATLSIPEVERLLQTIRRLKARGLGIIYISHRLDEVFALADRVTVLRDGQRVATHAAADLDRNTLIRLMVGRDIADEFPPRTPTPGETVLELRNFGCPPRVHGVSLRVRRGEVVGLAGLVGSGRTSMALAAAGASPTGHVVGEMELDGRQVRFRSPADALASGVAYVTEDRKARGVFPLMATGENVTVASLGDFTRGGWLRRRRELAAAEGAVRRFGIRARSVHQPARGLSGGNQQKALLARFLLRRRKVVILDEPTRGVDVGARSEIYHLINQLTLDGLGVLMISSDLPEVLGMSDRIVVMRAGATAGELARADATPERIMALATAS